MSNQEQLDDETIDNKEDGQIDFKGAKALASTNFVPVSGAQSFFFGLGNMIKKVLLFLLDFLLTVFKSIFAIVIFPYTGGKKLVLGVISSLKKQHEYFQEGDAWAKGSYAIMGLSSIKHGQLLNGFLLLISEIGFVLFMIFAGATNLVMLVTLGDKVFTPGQWDPTLNNGEGGYTDPIPGDNSIKCLLYGILTVLIIGVIVYLYFRQIKTANNNCHIKYNLKYRSSYETIISNLEKNKKELIEKISFVSTRNPKKTDVNINSEGKVIYNKFYSKRKIKKILEVEFGFDSFTAMLATRTNFKRIGVGDYEGAVKEVYYAYSLHRHLFDRYNVYNETVNLYDDIIDAYGHRDKIVEIIYARDKKSLESGVAPIQEGEKIVSKEAISRLVNSLRVDHDTAKAIFKLNLHKEDSVPSFEDKKELLIAEREAYINSYPEKYDGRLSSIKKQISAMLDTKFAPTVMFLPTLFAVVMVIIPLLFTVFIAFTEFDGAHSYPNLFNWVGFTNFADLFNGSGIKANLPRTVGALLSWTLIWAFFATFLNYIGGMVLALLINRKGTRLKKMWRTIFIITIAVPSFISLLSISKLLSDTGPINQFLYENYGFTVPFLSNSNTTIAKVTIIIVNLWIGIPYTMLLTSGILMNIPEDLYESARIDGAGPVVQFTKITLPYMLFVTGPYLITAFVGNINNFNVIYFLTGGIKLNSTDLYKAKDTDLLITWLYGLTTGNQNQYNVSSVLGMLIFVVCAFFSLIMYSKIGSTQREEEFQ